MKVQKKIYLDYNATTPTDPRVVTSMLPYFTEQFGNASSLNHTFGWEAEEAVEIAREQITQLIHAKSNELYFTSGATESIHIAIRGFAINNKEKGNHIITSLGEHKAVLATCQQLENEGFSVTYLPLDGEGSINLVALEEAITTKTILMTFMAANNETGIISPINKISSIAKQHAIVLMSDITQVIGKIPFDLKTSGIDIATFSSHKMYGPKGIGALYINQNISSQIKGLYKGGGQERNMRPGTLNVPAIVGFGRAAELCQQTLQEEGNEIGALRDYLEKKLIHTAKGRVIGFKSNRLPHVTNFTFININGTLLIRALKNIAVSQGSACTSNIIEPSHVLKAMQIPDKEALSAIRFSLGRFTTKEEIKLAIKDIEQAINSLT